MAAASLTVRIAADLNDFSRQLRKMTKDVTDAGRKVREVGEAMTIGITLPIVAAGVAMAKFGADSQAIAAKLNRQFGGATEEIKTQIEQLRRVVPETTSALEKMANQIHQFGDGLGMAAPQATMFSEEVLKMAAAISAANPGTPMTDAIDLLERGFEGSTKGLKSVGIAIDQAQVKQEAYRLGLVGLHQALTPLGTTLATYSLLVQRTTPLLGEAGKVALDNATKLQFLKSDILELAEAIGARLQPGLSSLISVGRGVVAWAQSLPGWLKDAAFFAAALAASLGPLTIAIVGISLAIIKVKAAIDLLKGVEVVSKSVGFIKDLLGTVGKLTALAIALSVVALSVIAIAIAWDYFKKKGQDAAKSIDAFAKKFQSAQALIASGGGKSAPTSASTLFPYQQLQQDASRVTSAFNDMVTAGDPLKSALVEINSLHARAVELLGQQTDKFGEAANAARKVALETQHLLDVQNAISALSAPVPATPSPINPSMLDILNPSPTGLLTGTITALVSIFKSALASPSGAVLGARNAIGTAAITPKAAKNLAGQARVSDEDQLRVREAALQQVDVYNALRVATVNLKEQFRTAQHDFATSLQSFKLQFSDLGGSLTGGLEAGLSGALASLGPFALAVAAIGKVMQGLQPVIDELMGPLVALGQIIGELIEPILKPLFQALKLLGIATALAGEVIYTVAGGIAKAVGAMISAIGGIIRKIPFLGGLGKSIQNFGNSISNFGQSELDAAKQLDRSRIQLQNLNFDDAANGLNSLAAATNNAAESMTNLPQAFKIALERFRATSPIGDTGITNGPGSSSSPSSGGGISPGSVNGPGGDPGGGDGQGSAIAGMSDRTPIANINLDGKRIAQVTWGHVRAAAKRQLGDPSRIADVATV